MQNGLLPTAIGLQSQPVDGAVASRAAYAGRPVEIACTVKKEGASGECSVANGAKVMENVCFSGLPPETGRSW